MKSKLLRGRTLSEIHRLDCGKYLGSGVHRNVYEHKRFPRKYVIKIEGDPSKGDFANVMEWRNYINNRDWKFLADFLAPCEAINETGQVLVMRRTTPIPAGGYPKEIPAIFTDTKKSNWGLLDGKPVCHDYSFFPIYFITKGGKKMKRPKWFSV